MTKHVVRKEATGSAESITELSALYGRWDKYVMTKAASLIGGLELSGVDPRTITEEQRGGFADLVRNAYRLLPSDTIITQYYIHYDNVKIALKPREDKRSSVLSKRRENFLNNERSLSGGRLFHLIDMQPKSNLNTLASLEFMGHMGNYAFSKKSRDYVATRLRTKNGLFATYENLAEQVQQLGNEINQIKDRFELAFEEINQLKPQNLWSLMRVLHTLNTDYFYEANQEPIPAEHWDYVLPDGDIEHVTINREDYLRFNGAETRYARIASIVGYGESEIEPGFWVNGTRAPAMQSGNYMFMSRWRPMSDTQKALMFFNRRTELERSQISFVDIMKGDDQKSAVEKQMLMSDVAKDALKELENARSLKDRYGTFCSHVLVFDKDPQAIVKACTNINNAITQAGGQLVWEKRGLMKAYESFLPGYKKSYLRDAVMTSSQFGACSHLYKSSEGLHSWGPNNEEAWYIFESEDGTPFHFTPYVGGRMVIIGIGPIRSGKTFTKNCIASHFQKFGGYFRAIDIDPGAEPVAEFFGDDAGMFRVEEGSTSGFNPLVSCTGPNDENFKAHMMSQIMQMVKANDSKELQGLTADEQKDIDAAINKTVTLEKPGLRSFNSIVSHLTIQTAKQKLARWISGGRYGYLMGNKEDAIGSFNKRIGTFNLAGVKDNPIILPLTMNEIFYRVTRLFENPKYRSAPKFLDVDEAHFLLGIPAAREKLLTNIRTWGKWNGGVGLWTQSAAEFEKIPEWAALRSAATTMVFMADSALDRAVYKRTFLLTEGELDAIEKLVPKRQALIIQREARISKVVNLHVEPEQYVINTSVAHEADIRRAMMREHGDPDIAIEKTIETLGLRKSKE